MDNQAIIAQQAYVREAELALKAAAKSYRTATGRKASQLVLGELAIRAALAADVVILRQQALVDIALPAVEQQAVSAANLAKQCEELATNWRATRDALPDLHASAAAWRTTAARHG